MERYIHKYILPVRLMPGANTAQAIVAGGIIFGAVVATIIVFQRLLVSYWGNRRYETFIAEAIVAGVIAIWGNTVVSHTPSACVDEINCRSV